MADYSIEVSVPNTGPQGEVGPVGPPNELTLGTVTTGDAGMEAAATISGTPPNQTLDLVIPRGDTGLQGTTGNAGPTGAGGLGVVPPEIYSTMQAAVEGGITFGGVYRHTSGSVFWVEEPDPDAAAFIASSGATDAWNIQKFVQGVKDLGLWDDMVCWPLRSAQNAGTGTTAYSLGGLGTFNGTLIGGPAWSASGVTFDGSDDHIEISNPLKTTTLAAYSIFSIFDSDQSINLAVFGSQGTGADETIGPTLNAGGSPFQGSAATSLYHDLTSDGASQIGPVNGSGRRYIDANTGAMQMGFAGFSGTEVAMSFNTAARQASSVSATTAWNDNATWNMGRRFFPSYYFLGTQAFNLLSDAYLTEQQTTDLYTLYKTTLGIGLSLP